MSKACNFSVRANPKLASKPNEVQNDILIKKFLRKWKKSGIVRELKEKSYPQTRGMKARKKRYLGKRRNNRNTNR
jgi:ribosomal protein S21